jgi:hypothetical protein
MALFIDDYERAVQEMKTAKPGHMPHLVSFLISLASFVTAFLLTGFFVFPMLRAVHLAFGLSFLISILMLMAITSGLGVLFAYAVSLVSAERL